MNRKKVFIILILTIVGFVVIFQARSYFVNVKKRPIVNLISPVKGKIVNKITAEGNIEAQDVMQIDAPISGKIQISKTLKIGTKINKDEIMIGIVPDEESIRSIKEDLVEAEESLRLSQKRFALLKQSYESEQETKIDKMNLERARRKYELSEKLYKLGVISCQDMETEKINFMREESNIAKRKENLLTELELEKFNLIKKETLFKKLKSQLEPKEIRTPFDGVITKINIKDGQIVSRGYELIRLVNLKELGVVLKVSGENISKLREGQKVVIRKEYYSTESIPGEIEEISMISEEGSSGGKNYFKVRVKLSRALQDDLIIGINKTVYGEIILEQKDNAITLPFDTIRYEENGIPYLFLYKDGKAIKQKIGIGIKGEECVEIIKGISLQDKIINQGSLELIDKQKVKIQSENSR